MRLTQGARRWLRGIGVLALIGALAGAAFVWWWIYSGGLPLNERVENSAGVFTLGAPNPRARTEAGGTACGGKLYVIGGIGAMAQTFTSVSAFDPKSNAWRAMPDLPQPINHPGVACAGGRLYVVGGFGPLGIRIRGAMLARWDPLDTVWILDPNTAQWTRGASMPEPRGAGGVTVSDGAVWYVGGIDQSRSVSADLFRFDVAVGSWRRMPPMPTARDHLRMEAVGGARYAISGRKDDLRFNLAATERYDVATEQWTTVADFPHPRGGLSSAVLHGKIYTFGGEHMWTCSDRIERYDPSTDEWSSIGRLPEARHGICAGVLDGKIHLVTGGRRPRVSISAIHRVLEPRTSGDG